MERYLYPGFPRDNLVAVGNWFDWVTPQELFDAVTVVRREGMVRVVHSLVQQQVVQYGRRLPLRKQTTTGTMRGQEWLRKGRPGETEWSF